MKKTNFLKIALTLVFAIAVIGVFGQAKDANLTVDQTVAHTVTVSKAIPFYVTPDSYFNPGYVAPGWAVTSTFLWSFDNAVLTGAVDPSTVTPTFSSNTVINPDITFNETGNYVLAVQESSADCDGSIRLQSITVIAAPTTDFGARPDVEQCGAIAVATDVLFDIANNTAADYLVDWTYDVDELAADKTTLLAERADLDATNTDDAFAANGAGLVLSNQTFPVLNGRVTRYTFTLTGINDEISRRSDYVSGGRIWPVVTFVNHTVGADDTFIVTVLPAPTTGPIYHLDI